MKTSKLSVIGPLALVALLAAGALVAALPLPASLVAVAVVLLALRVGVMGAALLERPQVRPRFGRPLAREADTAAPLRAAG